MPGIHRDVFKVGVLALVGGLASTSCHAVDGVFVAAGDGFPPISQDIQVNAYRIGAQWDWARRWFTEGNWYLGGRWEADIGYLEADSGETGTSELELFGGGAMFRLQRYPVYGASVLPYTEVGLGLYWLTEKGIGDEKLSTHYQFSPSIGLGLTIGSRKKLEVGYQWWHLSNSSIKEPNPGLDFHLIRIHYKF